MVFSGRQPMPRPTRLSIDATALLHNISIVRQYAPGKSIIAMVKANAYGCGMDNILHDLEGQVDALGVACLEEAYQVRELGSKTACILFQGVFQAEEWLHVSALGLQSVMHHAGQLNSLLAQPLLKPITIWVKVNTGMSRLGFPPHEVLSVLQALSQCPWVNQPVGLMTHFASADEPDNLSNQKQWQIFQNLQTPIMPLMRSTSNSAAIMALPTMHCDAVRPGIMLYGVSPFLNKTGLELGLKPVMRLNSEISVIHMLPPNSPVGYGGRWQSAHSSIIGVVPVGYGDGYPRVIAENTPAWIRGQTVPIVGRVSMDMLTVDLTTCPEACVGDAVELWGQHIPIEQIASSAGTIAYELMTGVSTRVRV